MTHQDWALEGAQAVARRTAGRMATFETGYGPSGQPHLGTLAEVLRTAMVARAYRDLTAGAPLRMLAICDDMDAMRRVPAYVQASHGLDAWLGTPLCRVPNPWGTGSFGGHNAALLRRHMAHYGLQAVEPAPSLERLLDGDATADDEVLCVMASDLYRGGHYDGAMRAVAAHADDICGVVLPELGAARRVGWCPFVPTVDARSHSTVLDWHVDGDTLHWTQQDGGRHATSILGGDCKLGWRVDWASRWGVLGVDYEMHGKDLADSVRVGSRIAGLLGTRAPVTMQYELFLDANGAKHSKSLGNGVELEDWTRHAPPGALWHFLQRNPGRARRITEDSIVGAVDAWLADTPPDPATGGRACPDYATIVGVAELADAGSPEVVWRLLEGYDPALVRTDPVLATLVECAVRRHLDRGRALLSYHIPEEHECAALSELVMALRACPPNADGAAVQYQAYEVGKLHGGQQGLREFFRLVYRCMLGKDNGPRLGSLAEATGIEYLVSRLEVAITRSCSRSP